MHPDTDSNDPALNQATPNPVRNTMTFEAKDLNYFKCRICQTECKNYEQLQIHFEIKHPVTISGEDFFQNGVRFATYNDECIIRNCTFSKKDTILSMKLQGIRQMKYRMLPGSDLSSFQGWLPFPEELEDEKGLFLCIYKTENGKQKKYEEKLETFLKTYGMMAVLTPKQFDELANQPLILPSRCPFLSRKRIKLTS